MNTKLLGALAVVSTAGMMFGGTVGCGDSGGAGGGGSASTSTTTTTSTTKSSSTATGTATSTSTGTGCSVPDTTDTCQHACEALYDCGALTCGAAKNCPGFSGMAAEKTAFVGDDMGGCVQNCNMLPALQQLIDPMDCAGTVGTIKAANMTFKMVCESGFSGTTSSSTGGGG